MSLFGLGFFRVHHGCEKDIKIYHKHVHLQVRFKCIKHINIYLCFIFLSLYFQSNTSTMDEHIPSLSTINDYVMIKRTYMTTTYTSVLVQKKGFYPCFFWFFFGFFWFFYIFGFFYCFFIHLLTYSASLKSNSSSSSSYTNTLLYALLPMIWSFSSSYVPTRTGASPDRSYTFPFSFT